MNLYTLRDAGAVKRYHTVRTIGQQTVAEHTFNMLHIVLELEPEASLNLIKAVMNHDMAEVITGDIPATFKWRFPVANDALAVTEKVIEEEFGLTADITDYEKLVLKYADLLELTMYCCEQLDMGNRFTLQILENGVSALQRLPTLNVRAEELVREQADALRHFHRVHHYHEHNQD